MRLKLLFLILIINGCEDSSPTIQTSDSVELTVSVSRNATGELELQAEVSNNTQQALEHWDNCNYWHGMTVHFVSKDYFELLLEDPSSRPWCPDTLVSLPPGGVLGGRSVLSGTLYTWDAEAIEMSADTYYAIVRFEWREVGVSTRHSLTHGVSFIWP